MIELLDNLMRQFLLDQIAELTDEAQVRFQPPDSDWRTYVTNLIVAGNPANALNVYLFDLRENRKLRSNERVRTVDNGVVNEEPAPARLDCHYLISAWSPANVTPAIEPALDEHALLYQTTAVLVRNGPFNPSRVYPAASAALSSWPAPFRDVDLPTVMLPPDGFHKLAEFWSGMGQGARWKPAIYLIVTVPVALMLEVAGPMVTTRITDYRITGHPETAEVWIQIGGHVFSPDRTVAVANSMVNAIGGGGNPVTVANGAVFRVGDVVTVNGVSRAMINQIAGNNLTLSNALTPPLAVGNTLRIADLVPSQFRFRVTNVAGLIPNGVVIITGDDAGHPGTTVTDRAEVEAVSADGFVTLKSTPSRATTFNLNVAPANAPVLREALPAVWVILETLAGERLMTTQTNELGRFTFGDLRAGSYRLRTRALGLAEITRVVDVPSPTGEYDVQFP